MAKNLLPLVASSTSLAAIILMAHSADASPIALQSLNANLLAPTTQNISLNQANPSLNLTNQASNPILQHLAGCQCAACMKSIQQISL